jgi:hypothetical protein
MLKIFKFFKDILLFIPVTLFFHPFSKLFGFLYYFNKLLIWINKNKKIVLYNDYFSLIRDYGKRVKLYDFVSEHFSLENKKNNLSRIWSCRRCFFQMVAFKK